ncbi:MAG: AmmeMemoRadiSam system protein B [SAR324 cluster bacterium]|nr:AmmeMemoRadiSam system protein B [SAR324 cluster bacterium]
MGNLNASIRQPAVANAFYSGNSSILRTQIQEFLESVPLTKNAVPKAIIAPHAGYAYSGPIAGFAYKPLLPAKNQITRVVLLGPAHRVYVSGLAAPSADYFATPLGDIPIDQQSIQEIIQQFAYVQTMDAAHAAEHSLEVHLPFLQEILTEFSLIPLVVGDAASLQVGAVLEALWGNKETLIVISSDLSHFHDYETANRLDLQTAKAIEQFDGDLLDHDSACGRNPIKGLLSTASKHQLKVQRADLRNSGDTAGSKDRVVGYGSWLFFED